MSHHDLAAALCGPCSDRGVIRVGTWEDGEHWYCDDCVDALPEPGWAMLPVDDVDYIIGGIVLGLALFLVGFTVALRLGWL